MEHGMSGFFIQPRSAPSSAERNGATITGTGMGTGTKCGRWNPTAEQVKVLTDLFRAGLRTPSTEQIQNISTQLSIYGKIESKNVFYWFQNHKARERQRRRRLNKDIHPSSCFQLQHLPMSSPPGRYLGGKNSNEVGEGEREIETLELFPMKESEKLSLWMLSRDQCKENNNHAAFTYTNHDLARDIDHHHHHQHQHHHHHPPLDLRLSFF